MMKTPPVFAIAQFCMSLSWVTYAAFLPAMAQQVGLAKSAVVWLLMLDQVVFMLADLLAGVASDRMAQAVARWGQVLGLLTGFCAVAFMLLPLLVDATGSPVWLVIPALVWVACSSALRAPLFALLGQHATSTTGSEFRWLLLGGGVAAAFAPYLQFVLKGRSPLLPFTVVAASLVLCAVLVGKSAAGSGAVIAKTGDAARPMPGLPKGAALFVALACAALALQGHNAFNSSRLFLRDVAADQLHWWLPAFWVGFNLAMLVPPLLKDWPAARRLALFGMAGVGALLFCTQMPSAELQAILQAAAGAAWALFLSTSFSTANALGKPQRHGRYAGGVHAVLAGGSLLRLVLVSAALPLTMGEAMLWLPPILWSAGAMVLLIGPGPGRRAESS